ncbi:Mbeg1-like protein [Streptococcus parauberis]|uniref:Mbeg1-like protein n=1 Tax=Streptococcus parauberis TaxID=1348 RepID=UPI0037A568AD
MPTLVDYITENKNKSFKDLPINELDIVAINEIGYLSFDDVVKETITSQSDVYLSELTVDDEKDLLNSVYNYLITKERMNLFHAIRQSKRFKDLALSHYINEIDVEFERQFAGMVFKIKSLNHVQVVFRGTDDSLIGWKEDFKLTYMREIPAHRAAIAFIKNYLDENPEDQIIVSGHSKGGTLALYGTSFITPSYQEAIKKVYLLDSPGLSEDLLDLPGYQSIRKKLIVIRPQESVVGVMLYCDVPPKIVKSCAFGVLQHKTSSWQVDAKGKFVTVPHPSSLSRNLELTFKEWNRQLSKQELKMVCDLFFDALISSGITSLHAFTFDEKAFVNFYQVLSSLRSIDQAHKAVMIKSMRQLIHDYTGIRKREVSKKIQGRIGAILKKRA